MSRRNQIILGVVGVLVLVLVLMWGVWRRRELDSASPPWLDPRQPPARVGAPGLTPEQSWAANRCRPFSAASRYRTAGLRTRRTYAETVGRDSGSFIRASFDVAGGV
jgi:hypothetical protein